MELSSALLPTFLTWFGHGLLIALLLGILRARAWRRLRDPEQLHVFLGATVALMVLWLLRVDVLPGLSFHLLGVTSLTLMFGWSLAIVSATVALAAVTLTVSGDWLAFSVNALLVAAVPITATQVMLILVRAWLPRHFFVYVFINAFLAAGLSALIAALLVLALLAVGDAYGMDRLARGFVPIFPLMFFPEAVLNGMLMTGLVAMRPRWVSSFSDKQYLDKK